MRNEKKLISSYTISENTSVIQNMELSNSKLLMVVTRYDGTDYKQETVENGTVHFDLRM